MSLQARISIALVAFVSCVVSLSGCGAGGDCAPGCDGVKADCREVGSELSALAAIAAAQPSARDSLGANARWVGALRGMRITRAGTPTTTPDSEIFGVKIYTAGWVFKYCANLDEIVYGAGPEISNAVRGCGSFDCSQLAPATLPAVDSPAAVSAAFPTDPNNTLYQLDYNIMLDGARVWSVTRLSDFKVIRVDSDSGAILP